MMIRYFFISFSFIASVAIISSANADGVCPWPASQKLIPIKTPQDLMNIKGCQPSTGKTFQLANDINMSGIQFDGLGGFYGGIFNGAGHIISYLTSNGGGLFSTLYGSALVKNLTLENVNIVGGNDPNSGYGVLTDTLGTATISNVIVKSGKMTGQTTSLLGGVVGRMIDGELTHSSSSVILIPAESTKDAPSEYNGELVGYEQGGTIDHSTSAGSIILTGYEVKANGGIVGLQDPKTSISSCSSSTTIDISNANEAFGNGVLVGYAGGNMKNVFANGLIKKKNSNVRSVSGGLVGKILSSGSLINGYSASKFDNGDPDADGGLVGMPPDSTNADLCVNSYWDNSDGIYGSALCSDGGRATNLMQAAAPTDYTYTGWDTQAWIFKSGAYPTLPSTP